MPPPPTPTQPLTFSSLLPLTRTTTHTYTCTLSDSFCIGTVPNGGYITSSFLLAARTHMQSAHPNLNSPDPINLHLEFLRRTSAGPATFKIRDVKLGSRITNLHLTLQQHRDANDTSTPVQDEVEGYITMTNMSKESGLSHDTEYHLLPTPLPASLPDLATNSDKNYIRRRQDPYGSFRRATLHCEMYLVRPPRRPEESSLAIADQWVRFTPLAEEASKHLPSTSPSSTPASKISQSNSNTNSLAQSLKTGTTTTVPGRWTNDALGYLVDIFPQLNERFLNKQIEDAVLTPESEISDEQVRALVRGDKDQKQSQTQNSSDTSPGGGNPVRTFWYPTLLLNLDVKKLLPEEGVEWLFVRVQAKKIQRGRFDLNVEVWDERGDLVALSTHASLILDASRNMTRKKGATKKESKI